MSMFSCHYLIRSTRGISLYWNGKSPLLPQAWGKGETAVRFQTRKSAEQVRDGLLAGISCEIEEDE